LWLSSWSCCERGSTPPGSGQLRKLAVVAAFFQYQPGSLRSVVLVWCAAPVTTSGATADLVQY
jgi:hypothetical protein